MDDNDDDDSDDDGDDDHDDTTQWPSEAEFRRFESVRGRTRDTLSPTQPPQNMVQILWGVFFFSRGLLGKLWATRASLTICIRMKY